MGKRLRIAAYAHVQIVRYVAIIHFWREVGLRLVTYNIAQLDRSFCIVIRIITVREIQHSYITALHCKTDDITSRKGKGEYSEYITEPVWFNRVKTS